MQPVADGSHVHLCPPGHGAFPLAAGLPGMFISEDACKKTLGLWNEQSARKMSVSRRFHCVLTVKRAQGLAVSSLKWWPCWICLPGPLSAQSGLLAGDEDPLTVYQSPGSHESSEVLQRIHLCIVSYREALSSSALRMAGVLCGWLTRPYSQSPTSRLEHHLGPLATIFAIFI